MPKKKQFLTEKKGKTKKPEAPATADEFLAAGVEFEEAGEKWRGGDAAKSLRFFQRAIDCYDDALKKFPESFDLAYNKARVQYEITQHPKLRDEIPEGQVGPMLETALASSRYALALKQDNADVLFNTAQVLTSLVEEATEARNPAASSTDLLPALEESLELFQRCLAVQEYQYTEFKAQAETLDDPDPEDGGVTLSEAPSATSSEPPQDDRWASIVEPVTNDTLLDTLIAQLEALALLCNTLSTSSQPTPLTFIDEYSSTLLNSKLPVYLTGTDRESEAYLTRANFLAAKADVEFRFQRINIPTYVSALEAAYAYQTQEVSNDPERLVTKAESLITFNTSVGSALREYRPIHETSNKDLAETSQLRWNTLTTAISLLTAATKLPEGNIAKIHLLRGDVEMYRYQLGQPYEGWKNSGSFNNSETLIKNAEKFYRGAAALAQDGKEKAEARVKEALAVGLKDNQAIIPHIFRKTSDGKTQRYVTIPEFEEVAEQALEEGLVFREQVEPLYNSIKSVKLEK